MAQASGGGVAADDLVAVRMHGKGGAEVVEGLKGLLREVAPLGQHRNVARCRVALGEDKAVPVLPLGIGRVDLEVLEVEDRQNVDDAERSPHMGPAGPGHHVDDGQAQFPGQILESLLLFHRKCHWLYLPVSIFAGVRSNRKWIVSLSTF